METKGEKAAEEIITMVKKKFPNEIQSPERQAYIEQEVKKRAAQVDNDFHAGMKEVFTSISKEAASKGKDAGVEAMFEIMSKRLGLNIDKDNMQTHFDSGPPQIFQVSWVNRPSKNLANPNSKVMSLLAYIMKISPRTRKQILVKFGLDIQKILEMEVQK